MYFLNTQHDYMSYMRRLISRTVGVAKWLQDATAEKIIDMLTQTTQLIYTVYLHLV